jgi:exopolysaccharide biosynthesis polyprenyl glycosylphosphotransferase
LQLEPSVERRAEERNGARPILGRLNAHGIRLLQPADALVLFGFMVAVSFVRFERLVPADRYWGRFLIATVIFLTVFYFGGLYERELRLGSRPRLPRIVSLVGLGALVIAAVGQMTGQFLMPRANLLAFFVAASVGVAGNRRWSRWLRIQREGFPRVLLVGAPDEVNLARKHIEEAGSKVLIAGEAGGVSGLLERVRSTRATEVLLLSSRMLDELYPEPLSTLEDKGVGVLQIVGARDSLLGLRNVCEIGGMPFVALYTHVMPVSQTRLKRLLDLFLLVVMAPVALPLLVLLACYVRLAAGSPVVYRQKRVGRDGTTFGIVKFRTMYDGAELATGPVQALRDDPRVVPALGWLRETRLDELPQLWNVLRGQMSVVGPRPERPEMTDRFETLIPGYGRRHEVPPGITGLAQVHGRYHTDPEYKLGHDLQYLVNWSPVLDVQVLLRTIWVVLARQT